MGINAKFENFLYSLRSRLRRPAAPPPPPRAAAGPSTWVKRGTEVVVAGLAAVLVLYLLIGEFTGEVNNRDLAVTVPKGGNALVATLAGTIQRELDTGWCPSGSYLLPSHIRYDMCAFQEGEQLTIIRMAQQAANHLTREGSASSADPDMNAALNAVNRGNNWSLFLSNSTVDQYRRAVGFLNSYNSRLSQGKVTPAEPRIDMLSGVLVDLSSIIGDESIQLRKSASNDALFSMSERAALFHGLGVLQGACLDLRALQTDFASVIRLQSAADIFGQAVSASCATQNADPFLVLNGRDFSLIPSDLHLLAGYADNALNDLTYVQSSIAAGSVPHGPGGP